MMIGWHIYAQKLCISEYQLQGGQKWGRATASLPFLCGFLGTSGWPAYVAALDGPLVRTTRALLRNRTSIYRGSIAHRVRCWRVTSFISY